MPSVQFWYEFASTYSYPAAARIEDLARSRGLSVNWRPFLLGAILAQMGVKDSPFNLYPAKGRYMWRDIARICRDLGLPLNRPTPFPQRSLLAARTAWALAPAARGAFSRAVYRAQFAQGLPIDEPRVIADILVEQGHAPEAVLADAASPEGKARLREATEDAARRGLFGAPSIVTGDGELFWGNDRLEQALDWAAALPAAPVP
jgi:2-hydroxychromene-2-carboxylate isomerase